MLSPTPIKQSYHTAAKFAIVKLDSPIQPAILDNGPTRCYKKLRRIQGRRQLRQSEVEAIASSCFAQIIAE